jgi:hypothetical protein
MFYNLKNSIIYLNIGVIFAHHQLKMMSTSYVLRISSAHNKGGPPDINIAQILHLSNFFELKHTVYIHLQV